MCGFAGKLAWDERYRTTPEALSAMSRAIAHRGPDGEALWINHDGAISPEAPQVAFAFRRLAVLDVDPRAMQPMHSPDGRFSLVFNGEIYNFQEIRKELEKDTTWDWKTSGDAEVLLASYARWGADCLKRLNGMFAIAIWDAQERKLFLARDRMGQKPLYVGFVTSGFYFGSELGPLASEPFIENESTFDWLSEYLALGYTRRGSRGLTIQLPPGHSMLIDSTLSERSGLPLERYFDPNKRSGRTVTSLMIRNAIERAVERQLISDVPLGVFLSGGIDSSIIALCARKQGQIRTFSVGFDDVRYDESPYARDVAIHLKSEHTELRVKSNVIDDLPKLVRVFGMPFADSSALPTLALCRETRKHVTVALSGDGGDELFGGYDRYIAMSMSRRWRALKPLARIARKSAGGHPKSTRTRAMRFIGSLDQTPGKQYESFLRIFDEELLTELLIEPRLFQSDIVDVFDSFDYKSGVERAIATDRVTYLPDDLHTKIDRASMLVALEVRAPFMDHELVELAADLSESELIGGGKKRMLREIFAPDLPRAVFERPKMGFSVPIGEWFASALYDMLRDRLLASDSFAREHFNIGVVERLLDEHRTARRDHAQRLYSLLVLEEWWKQQLDPSSAPSTV